MDCLLKWLFIRLNKKIINFASIDFGGNSMILELLKKRCSIRNFQNKNIPHDIIDSILEAGRLSPSGGNEQSWKFGVITDKELISQIAESSYNQSWIKTSPLLIVLCTIIVEDKRGARNIQKRRFPRFATEIDEMKKELYSYLNLEEHQTKISGTHMGLCALENGIYSTWVSYFDVEKISQILRLPDNLVPSEIIAFGYPADEPKIRDKKSIDELVFYNYFVEDEVK